MKLFLTSSPFPALMLVVSILMPRLSLAECTSIVTPEKVEIICNGDEAPGTSVVSKKSKKIKKESTEEYQSYRAEPATKSAIQSEIERNQEELQLMRSRNSLEEERIYHESVEKKAEKRNKPKEKPDDPENPYNIPKIRSETFTYKDGIRIRTRKDR